MEGNASESACATNRARERQRESVRGSVCARDEGAKEKGRWRTGDCERESKQARKMQLDLELEPEREKENAREREQEKAKESESERTRKSMRKSARGRGRGRENTGRKRESDRALAQKGDNSFERSVPV